jgi:hypothetical protein
MEISLQSKQPAREHIFQVTLARGIGLGLMGGFAGTLIMDFTLMVVLSALGLPALTCFSIVGDTVARFLSIQGIKIAGGVPTGIATHYLVGPLLGAIFGAILAKFNALRVNTQKKSIVLAVIFVEIFSQPILAATPILMKMTLKDTLQWFGASFVMHFLYGVVLGAIISHGLRLVNTVRHA